MALLKSNIMETLSSLSGSYYGGSYSLVTFPIFKKISVGSKIYSVSKTGGPKLPIEYKFIYFHIVTLPNVINVILSGGMVAVRLIVQDPFTVRGPT